MKDPEISLIFQHIPFFIKKGVKNRIIDVCEIYSYEQSNIFFVLLDLFSKQINKKDIYKIFNNLKDNDQASLWPFLEKIEKEKPDYLIPEIKNYLRTKQAEWRIKNDVEK